MSFAFDVDTVFERLVADPEIEEASAGKETLLSNGKLVLAPLIPKADIRENTPPLHATEIVSEDNMPVDTAYHSSRLPTVPFVAEVAVLFAHDSPAVSLIPVTPPADPVKFFAKTMMTSLVLVVVKETVQGEAEQDDEESTWPSSDNVACDADTEKHIRNKTTDSARFRVDMNNSP